MTQILEGKAVAKAMAEDLARRSAALRERGVEPRLAVVRMGSRGEDIQYERSIARLCAQLGIDLRTVELPESADTEALIAAVDDINADAAVHGCLLMRPFPEQIDEARVCERLRPEKDVDGVSSLSLSGVFTGRRIGFCPCTAQACLEMLDYYEIPLAGKQAVVIGRSLVVGKPLAMLLTGRDATVTLCHTRTAELDRVCRRAEILISAAGCPALVDVDAVGPGQVLLDVGLNVDGEGHICGDAAFERVMPLVSAITPVPGGVGRVTTAVLCKHVIEAAEAL